MIHLHMAPDMEVNSTNREILRLLLPANVRINGYPHGQWEFPLQKTDGESYPEIGSVSIDLKRIRIKLEKDKSVPDWVIRLAESLSKETKTDVDIFLEQF